MVPDALFAATWKYKQTPAQRSFPSRHPRNVNVAQPWLLMRAVATKMTYLKTRWWTPCCCGFLLDGKEKKDMNSLEDLLGCCRHYLGHPTPCPSSCPWPGLVVNLLATPARLGLGYEGCETSTKVLPGELICLWENFDQATVSSVVVQGVLT